MKNILIIDGNNMAARFAYAHTLFTSDGIPSGVIFGLLNYLRRILVSSRYKYKQICFVFDSYPKFRHLVYPEYKAQRKEKRDVDETAEAYYEMYREQLEYLKVILSNLNIIPIILPEYEVDDVVYKMCRELKEENIVIYSSDKDFTQIIQRGRVVLARPNHRTSFESYIKERPRYYVLKRLMEGDSSDNIKGVAGIGEKRAQEVVDLIGKTRFKDFINNLDQAGKWSDKLKENEDILKRNYKLMVLAYAYKHLTKKLKPLYVKSRFSITALKGVIDKFELKSLYEDTSVFQKILLPLDGVLPEKYFKAVDSIDDIS